MKIIKPLNIEAINFKKYAWHLRVQGAYVQSPVPGIYGLNENEVIASNDASALYPTSIIFSNISNETLKCRLYDTNTVKNIVFLIQKIFELKKKTTIENIKKQVLPSFNNAMQVLLKEYFKRHHVSNKSDATKFTEEYYNYLLEKIIEYPGDINSLFEPKDDAGYITLRSYFFPLIESISWLSPQNKGYNQIIIDYLFQIDIFDNYSPQMEFYLFDNYNSTKLQFKILTKQELVNNYFKRYLLNPYGTLFYTHDEKTAFEVNLIIKGLNDRRIVKNKMLVLEAIIAQIEKAETLKNLFKTPVKFISEEDADKILEEIQDKENRKKRIQSLTTIDFDNKSFEDTRQLVSYLETYASQMNSIQNGIKVFLNSGYGILGLITYEYSDILAANSITTAGKIFGIKMFQAVSKWTMDAFNKELHKFTKNDLDYQNKVDLKLIS